MEMLLYLFSNWCQIAAGFIVIFHYYSKASGRGKQYQLMISEDMLMLLCMGTFVRVYWSLSPPAIWTDEPWFIQIISQLDIVISPLIWLLVVAISDKSKKWVDILQMLGLKQQDRVIQSSEMGNFDSYGSYNMNGKTEDSNATHWMCSWKLVSVFSLMVSYLGTHVLPSLHSPGAWPGVDFMVVLNMIMDGAAMIPQVYLIANSQKKATNEASHFVGLLCLGRVFRMLFWGWLLLHPDAGNAIWTFIVPDLIHTVIMADFFYVWLQKVRRDALEAVYDFSGAMSV